MRTVRRMRWLAIVVLGLAGCHTTEPDVKPKYQTEEFVAPPRDDPRYNKEMTYPKETLFDDVIKKDTVGTKDPLQSQNRFGAGPGMPGGRPGGF